MSQTNGRPGPRGRTKRAHAGAAKLSRLRRPESMSLEDWQVALRRQFGQQQKFRIENLGAEPVFSEFRVTNPQSGRSYRVAIRGAGLGDNFCSCPDFTVNTLGTCKHVEFTLAWLARRRGGKQALAKGFHPPYSEVYIRYGAKREVVFRPGTGCPPPLRKAAAKYFASDGRLLPDAFGRFQTFLKAAESSGHEVRCYDDALVLVAQVRDRAALAERVNALFPRGIASAAFKRLLKVPLYAADSFFKIANYDVVYRDLARIQAWRPDLVILDEAQRIKNWKTRTAQSVKRLESPYALVLTGTPLENRLEELYSIVEFVDRYRLGPMFRFLDAHQHVDETGRVVGYRALNKIAQTLEPILVRRTKDKVLAQLPERMEKQLFVSMTAAQLQHHEENRETVARLVSKWRRCGFLTESDQRRLLIALQNMRMSCDSTYLLDQKTDHGVKADELVELLGEMLEDPRAKVVVFSQWLRMHELIVRRLERKKWSYVLFHGGVPGTRRRGLIDRFREDPQCRLFLATDAGGVGLNLQHASAVVNLDLPWNPAVLEQRIGRVHRLGQHRPVRVVNFVAQGTIEEGMLSLLAFKKSVFSGVLDGGQSEVFLGGTRLTRFMESVEKATANVSQPMPAEADGNGHAPAEAEHAEAKHPARGKKPQREAAPGAPSAAAPENPWAELVSAGMSLVQKVAQAFDAGRPREPGEGPAPRIERDDRTGQPYLKLPLPPPEIAGPLQKLLAELTKALRT